MLASLVVNSIAFASPVLVADIFVDGSNPNCASGTGTAISPVCSISAAIGLAAPGDTIRIAPGTYNENVVTPFDLVLFGIRGQSLTTIDGTNSGSVVTIPAAVTVRIEGLTLTNGNSPAGGAVHLSGSLELLQSTLTNNSASLGGAIHASDGVLTIQNSTICQNSSSGDGGGLYGVQSTLAVTDSVIADNNSGSKGGGVYWRTGDLVAERSTIANNNAMDSGGGLRTFGGDTTISNSTIAGNASASGISVGGGVDTYTGTLHLSNSTISGNSSGYGGGIGFFDPTSTSVWEHITVTGNYAGYFGGGIRNCATVQVRNSLIAQNTSGFADDRQDIHIAFMSPIPPFPERLDSQGGNLIGISNHSAFDEIDLSDLRGSLSSPILPGLLSLADNGGPTETHALAAGSLAIDLGAAPVFPSLDQRGFVRPRGFGPDCGAFESAFEPENLCNGDGGDQLGCTDCPCGNNATAGTVGGCLNSSSQSSRLIGSGSRSVSLPAGAAHDLKFAAAGVPPNAFCLLQSGDSVAPGGMANPCFGQDSGTQAAAFDGLRCAIMNTRRHGGRTADLSGQVGFTSAPWGGEGGPPAGIANAGGGFLAGQTRYFQVVHRDNPTLGCMRGLNTSQAVEVTFNP